MNILKRQHFTSNILSIFLILIGIILLFTKENADMLLTYFLGSVAAFIGAIKLIIFISSGAIYRKNDDLLESIFLLAFGMALIINNKIIFQNIPIIVGLFLTIKASFILSEAIDYKKLNIKNWLIDIIFLSFIIFYAILLLFFTKNISINNALNIISLGLISDGLCSIILASITFKKTNHKKINAELLEGIAKYSNYENMINR